MEHFNIIDLEQGSPEWLKWRLKGVGASDAPVIMNENRWKTSSQLLVEKLTGANYQNDAMRRGTELEPIARASFEKSMGIKIKPVCLQSKTHYWMLASVDGMTLNYDRVVEIKCGKSAYRYAVQNQSVPSYNYGQLQHILAVTNLQVIDYWSYDPYGEPVHLQIERDDAYIQRLIVAEESFHKRVQKRMAEAVLAHDRITRAPVNNASNDARSKVSSQIATKTGEVPRPLEKKKQMSAGDFIPYIVWGLIGLGLLMRLNQ